MISHTTQIRVRYQETDAMGIVYHGNYLTWFEIARIDLLENIGLPYRELEAEGYFLPVLEANARYFSPCRFDELINIECRIEAMPRVKIRIDYTLTRDGTRLTTGHTLHAFMGRDGFASKPPERFIEALKPHF